VVREPRRAAIASKPPFPVASEEVDGEREVAAFDVFEEERPTSEMSVGGVEPPCRLGNRGAAALAHAVGDLGRLEDRRDRLAHPGEFAGGVEGVDEVAEGGMHGARRVAAAAVRPGSCGSGRLRPGSVAGCPRGRASRQACSPRIRIRWDSREGRRRRCDPARGAIRDRGGRRRRGLPSARSAGSRRAAERAVRSRDRRGLGSNPATRTQHAEFSDLSATRAVQLEACNPRRAILRKESAWPPMPPAPARRSPRRRVPTPKALRRPSRRPRFASTSCSTPTCCFTTPTRSSSSPSTRW
jgi:hypothetical protein